MCVQSMITLLITSSTTSQTPFYLIVRDLRLDSRPDFFATRVTTRNKPKPQYLHTEFAPSLRTEFVHRVCRLQMIYSVSFNHNEFYIMRLIVRGGEINV